MTFTFYNYSGEPNTIQKSLPTGTQITAKFRGEFNEKDPYITAIGIPADANYAYCTDNGYYYYCEPRNEIRTGIYGMQMHRDPLMSFASQILALPAIAARAQTDNDRYSSYLRDEEQRVYAYKTIATKLITTFTYGSNYVLITAG